VLAEIPHLAHWLLPTRAVDKSYDTKRILALAGRRIDPPGAESRFPVASIPRVKSDLRERINSRVEALICSAACGADLLALATADRMGVPYHIVLPFPTETFRKTSVVDRPGEDWGAIFDHVIGNAAQANRLLTDDLDPESDASFRTTNRRIIELARAIGERADLVGEMDLVAVVVWEGQSRGADDTTDHFLKLAKEGGFDVETILTLGTDWYGGKFHGQL
jgi:hypothetical protein